MRFQSLARLHAHCRATAMLMAADLHLLSIKLEEKPRNHAAGSLCHSNACSYPVLLLHALQAQGHDSPFENEHVLVGSHVQGLEC